MWVYDRQTLRFLAVNTAAIEHYGYSQEEFLAMTLADIRPPEEVSRLLENIHEQPRSGPARRFQEPWKHRKKDGTVIEVEIVSQPIDFGGVAAKLVLAHDITEERKLEQQFRQAQKMEAIGRLAGGVAHDFNNLLMVIGSFAELIGRNAENPEKSAEYLGHIRGAVDKAASLTRQLLAFSRKQMLELRVLEFNELVTGLCRMLPAMLGEDVKLALNTTARECPVYSDKTQLEQVIMNLVVNARDAMPKGGELAIETNRLYLDGKYFQGHATPPAPGEYVVLSVSDTGEGMDAATQAQIFEPFFSTKEPGKGTGLGLSTVFGIVKQSGGFIWVYSEIGKGSTFKVYLPCAEMETEVPAPAPDAAMEPGGTETVLLVEDELAVRIATMEFLQSKGYTVLTASNDVEALRAAASPGVHIDLLLTDLVMPGMGGKELAERLCGEHPETRVVFMSGYPERTSTVNGLGASATFLQKPFTLATLVATIRQVLDRGQ
jgi:PAS domain S-box-containing protein